VLAGISTGSVRSLDAKRSSLSNFKVGKRVISGDKIVR